MLFKEEFVPGANVLSGQRRLASRIGLWFSIVVGIILTALFVASFFLDSIIRPRIESRMNNALKGYHLSLDHAHLQLLSCELTLRRMVITQDAHPAPPVADFPLTQFRIRWQELLSGRVVANVELTNPRLHLDRTQAAAEHQSKAPLRERGWQDALQSAYPFKINRLAIRDGDVTYLDDPHSKPLHLARLNFITDNIRNIHEPNDVYPSDFTGHMVVFESGELTIHGKANYLMKPFPGLSAHYSIKEVPLSALDSVSRHINIVVSGGTFASEGAVEYSPKVTNVHVPIAIIQSTNLTYIHANRTQVAEQQRATATGKAIEKQNNRAAVNIKLDKLEIRDSRIAFDNQASNPRYTLFIDDADLKITNLGNHAGQGNSRLSLTGKFMNSGQTQIEGTFAASGPGPELNADAQILNADLTALNPLLQSEDRIDVAQGQLTVYTQIGIQNDQIRGYVKPIFSNLKVYDYRKDKTKPVAQQAKEVLVGAAARMLKNHQTQNVATRVDLAGTLKNPDVSNWQALVEVVRNAFVQAILPGFDREVRNEGVSAPGAPSSP